MSLARIFKKTKGRQTFVSDSRWILPTTFIGLEHEYEGVKLRTLPTNTFADFWEYHEEGSLKDNGAEYVFATPLFGTDAYNALEWLVSHAKSSGWKCTKRTGIHVHLDVRDLSISQLAGLCLLYAAVEPILYRWIGSGRDVSHFCIPLYRADETLLSVCTILKAAFQDDKEGDGEQALQQAEAFQRYAGFNMQALFKFGSVEFRHLETTHDINRIVDWVNIVMSLKAAAFKLPQSDGAVVRMLQRMDIEELLKYVFPEDIAKKLYTLHSKNEFETIGIPSARDIAVHGCGDTSWVSGEFPRGEHPGFVKWLKSARIPKKSEEYEPLEELQWIDEPERPAEAAAIAAAVAGFPPGEFQAGQDVGNGVMVNFANLQNMAAAIEPPPLPPPIPRLLNEQEREAMVQRARRNNRVFPAPRRPIRPR